MSAERGRDVAHNPALPARLQHVSPSQLKSWLECPRKWVFGKIKQVSSPDTRATLKGRDVHSVLEAWARFGERPPSTDHASRLASAAFEHLPEWHPGLWPEANMATDSPLEICGVPFVGFVDLIDPESNLIVDYKTTKDLGYAKTEDELRQDPQAIGYARWLMLRDRGADAFSEASMEYYEHDTVTVRYVYLLSRIPRDPFEPRTKVVEFRLSARDTCAPWARFEQIVREMLAIARDEEQHGAVLSAIPANLAACEQYGGCPHFDICPKEPGVSLTEALFQIRVPQKESAPMGKNLTELLEAPHAPEPFDLFIDCAQVSGEPAPTVTQLDAYLATIAAQGAAEAKVPDLLCLEFGKWKGPLRAAVRANPPRGAVFARSIGELALCALEVLRPMARVVVQGVR